MRFAMYGSGGVGGYFGGRLAAAGHDVTFVARGAHLQALREQGLHITSIKGNLHLEEVHATDDPGSVDPVDVVLVAVKTWQLDDALDGIARLAGPESLVVPLLNGVEAADRLADALGRDRVLKGLTRILAYLDGPGHVRHTGAEPTIVFGEWDNRPSPRTRALLEALEGAGVQARIPDDVDAALWEKFSFVVSVGGVGAVTRAPIGRVRRDPHTRALLQDAMLEILAVARARGVALSDEVVPRAMSFVDTLPEGGSASLQRDLAAGRPSELEAWSGAVVRLGRAAGVATPIHGFIMDSLRLQEARARGEAVFQTPGEAADPFRARYLAEATARFEALRELAERALAQVDDEAFFLDPDPRANSLAVLVKHVAGNLRSRWDGFPVEDGEKPDRNRDGEFVAEGQGRADLMAAWARGWRLVQEQLTALEPADLDRTVFIRNEPHTVERAVGRSLAHVAGHVGQIVQLARHHAGAHWQTLSIPPGESEQWMARARARFGERPQA